MTLFRKQMMGGVLLLVPVPGQAKPFDHERATWNLLLKNNVHWNLNRTASQVNYSGFQKTHDFLHDFFRTHGDWIADDAESVETLREAALRFEFLDYDWSLNTLR